MCNFNLKYPRGMSIVVCIFLYLSLVGLLVAFFQPYWLVIPNESQFQCLNSTSKEVNVLTTNDQGACGISGICYPMTHTERFNLSCYPNMGEEKCIWYTELSQIGTTYDQVVTLLFLVGLVLCVFAWFLTMFGCCTLTCCCCNVYSAIAFLLSVGTVAMLVSVLLWFGMMGEYNLTDESCVNIFCNEISVFNPGSCTIGWSGYLGFASWLLLVVTCFVTCCTASHYKGIIAEEAIPARNMVNPYEKRRGGNDNAFYFKDVPAVRKA